MTKSPQNSKKQAGRPKSKPGCSACKQRRLKCDETLPICQHCESSGRICKGLSRKMLTPPRTIAPSNSTAKYGRTSAEAGAGLREVHQEDSIVAEVFDEQKEKNTQDQKPTLRPDDQGGDCRPSTLMVLINHSELSANTPEQTISEDELAEEAILSCHVSAVASRKDFQNPRTVKRAADPVLLSDAEPLPNTKRARREEQEAADLMTISPGTVDEHIQTIKEDKHLKSATASDTSEAPSRTERIVSRASIQVSSDDCDAVQTAKLALDKSTQDKMPPDLRIELSCASTYSHSTGRESQQPRTREGSACIDRQPLATGDFNKSHGVESPNQLNNRSDELQPSPSASWPQNSQKPSNPKIPTHDRQSLVDLLHPSEPDQDPRRLRNSRTADIPSQNTLTSGSVRLSSASLTFGISSATPSGQSPVIESSFRSVTQNPDLSRTSPHTPNETSMQDKHAGGQSSQLQRVSHLSNHLNTKHYPKSQRNELGPGDASGVLRDKGTYFVSHNQQQLSRNSISPRRSIPQREKPDHQLRSIEQNLSTSSSRHLLPPQRTYQPPAVTFTADNRIRTALPMATLESLFETFSLNCKVLLGSKRTLAEDIVYPVDAILWQHSPDFYKWYMAKTRTANVSTLRFELYDVDWKLETTFYISVSNMDSFLMLKQRIWDSFWVVSEKSHTTHLTILVEPAPYLDNQALARNAMNATASGFELGVITHPQPPAVTVPQTYTEETTRQTTFAFPPRPIDNAAAPQIPLPLVRTTQFPDHGESSMKSSSQFYGSSIPVDVATQIPHRQQLQDPPQLRNPNRQRVLTIPPPAPEISVRLQTDGAGKVSNSYSKWVLRPRITSSDFFTWFASQTGRGGDKGPPSLKFTFKDAMPCPVSSTITQADEDHFNLLKRELRTQLDRVREYVPNLREFVVLVTDPGWGLEGEDW